MKLPGRLPRGRHHDAHIQARSGGTPTRRALLRVQARALCALVLGVHVPFAERAGAASAPRPPFDPNVFLRIGADNTVTILSKHFEMGQGITTGLATLVAEELEADWAQMRVASPRATPSSTIIWHSGRTC